MEAVVRRISTSQKQGVNAWNSLESLRVEKLNRLAPRPTTRRAEGGMSTKKPPSDWGLLQQQSWPGCV